MTRWLVTGDCIPKTTWYFHSTVFPIIVVSKAEFGISDEWVWLFGAEATGIRYANESSVLAKCHVYIQRSGSWLLVYIVLW